MQTTFPELAARDLNGRELHLPEGLEGECNILVVAFRAPQQFLIDSWAAHLGALESRIPGVRWYEVPCISRAWAPARPFIDGGMAAAVDPPGRARTVTVYGELDRLTSSVASIDRRTVTLLVLDRGGVVRGSLGGRFDIGAAASLDRIVEAVMAGEDPEASETFEFEFEDRYRPLLRLLGVTPETSSVVVGDGMLRCRFGPWSLDTPLSNITCVSRTGPYRGYRAIGARGSFADRGVTFGTTTRGGLCVEFAEPVPALLPTDAVRHPGLTLTVRDIDGLAEALSA